MKTAKKLSLCITLITLIFFTGLISCKKETVVENTVTTDTVNIYTPITLAVVTANKWMFQEIRGVRGSDIFTYVRGGSSNSENLDDEYLDFHNDYTVTIHEQSGFVRTIAWEFSNSDNSKITFHYINTPANFDLYYDNIRCKDNKLYFDEYYTDGNLGWNSHTQDIRIPKP